jgi:hypothetical protein
VFIIKKTLAKIKNVKNVKKRGENKKRKKRFLHLCFTASKPMSTDKAVASAAALAEADAVVVMLAQVHKYP